LLQWRKRNDLCIRNKFTWCITCSC